MKMRKLKRSKVERLLTCSNELLQDVSKNIERDIMDIIEEHEVNNKDEFLEKLQQYDYDRDNQGMFNYTNDEKVYHTNFTHLEFLHSKEDNGVRIRVLQINEKAIEFHPQDLLSVQSFNRKLLSKSDYSIDMTKNVFKDFREIILSLDKGKIVEDKHGFGKIGADLYNLGNKVWKKNKLVDFSKTLWIENKGYTLEETDMISISESKIDLKKLWDYFFRLYGKQAILIFGYATATMFFQRYMTRKKHFPLLYILAASGRGKGGLTELICQLFGMNLSLANVNCAGNATKIGIESKSLLLNNLPMVLNELSEGHFDFIKSRYDGQGSVKYDPKNPQKALERTVNGSTIITTVVEPFDKQVVSRCIFISLDTIKMNKPLFDEARQQADGFSCFITEILKNLQLEDILSSVEEFGKKLSVKEASPRIIENYALVGGCFLALQKIISNSEQLPDEKTTLNFIEDQIHKTESYLNPLIYFIRELERLLDKSSASQYIAMDQKYVYFNFNGVWSIIKDSYKKKYFPYMSLKNIKELLKKSPYIAHYDEDIKITDKTKIGKPITSHSKKIGNKAKRCVVLKKDKLPGYYS